MCFLLLFTHITYVFCFLYAYMFFPTMLKNTFNLSYFIFFAYVILCLHIGFSFYFLHHHFCVNWHLCLFFIYVSICFFDLLISHFVCLAFF